MKESIWFAFLSLTHLVGSWGSFHFPENNLSSSPEAQHHSTACVFTDAYPFISGWPPSRIPCPIYCQRGCDKHGSENSSTVASFDAWVSHKWYRWIIQKSCFSLRHILDDFCSDQMDSYSHQQCINFPVSILHPTHTPPEFVLCSLDDG